MKKRWLPKNPETSWRRLSISQQDLAKWLGISVSLLSMHDKGLRPLPSKASLKLAGLLKEYVKAANATTMSGSLLALQHAFEAHHNDAAEKMMIKADGNRYRKGQLENSLKEITEKQEQDKIWLHVIEDKLAELPGDVATEGESQWLKNQHDKISQRLLKANKELARLPLEIELLAAATEVHESHHRRLKKNK